jgi:hypothetical protein
MLYISCGEQTVRLNIRFGGRSFSGFRNGTALTNFRGFVWLGVVEVGVSVRTEVFVKVWVPVSRMTRRLSKAR